MASWDLAFGPGSVTFMPPHPGKFRITSITFYVQGAPTGDYYDDEWYDPGHGKPGDPDYREPEYGSHKDPMWCDGDSLTGVIPGSGTISLGTGGKYSGGSGDDQWVHGTASAHTFIPPSVLLARNGITISVSGGRAAVGNCDNPYHVEWDWAFGNYHFNYCDGHVDTRVDNLYGTNVESSHTIGHYTYYIGNGGTPARQVRDRSYVSSASHVVTADDCAVYPNFIEIDVPGQPQYFIRKGEGIVLPTLEDYLFEGWWGVQNSRSGRGAEWLDGKPLSDHGEFTCYAHWMTSPVHERRDGIWHRWLPPDMNAQSVNGTKTVNNIRSKHEDGTWPLDKPIYKRVDGQWIQHKGPMIPPDGS